MTNEQKASEIAKSFVSKRIENSASKIFTLQIESACKQMAQWKDEQLDSAIDKSLERNGEFLKAGKITQYGYDMAFVTIQNIREYLKQL